MMTYTNDQHTNTDAAPGGLDRTAGRAVRFLQSHRLGRLLTSDPITGEPFVSPVHYVIDDRGGFLALLPTGVPQIAAIQAGGSSVLSVESRFEPDAARHVQAQVDVELVHDADTVREILRRQVQAVLRDLPQHDKSDPIPRAGQSEVEGLVGLRIRVVDVVLRERARPPAITGAE